MAALSAPLHPFTSVSVADAPASVIARSPDGDVVATGGDAGAVQLWRTRRGPTGDGVLLVRDGAALAGPRRPVSALAFSPDGRFLAAGSLDGTARIWDLGGPAAPRVVRGHGAGVTAVAFEPGPRRRLVTAGRDGRLRQWDVTGRSLGELAGLPPGPGGTEGITTFTFTADGDLLVVGGDAGGLAVRTHPAGVLVRPAVPGVRGGLRNPTGEPATAMGVSGRRLAVAFAGGEVRLWRQGHDGFEPDDVSLGRVPHAPAQLAFAPGGRHLAVGGEDLDARLWSLPAGPAPPAPLPGERLTGTPGAVRGVVFLDADHVAGLAAGPTLRVWDTAADRPLGRLLATSPDGTAPDGTAPRVAFSPDGGVLAVTAPGGRLRLWDVARRQPRGDALRLGATAGDVAFGPWGRRAHVLLAGGEDGVVRRWDAGTQEEIRPALVARDAAPDDAVRSLAARPGAPVVAVGHESGRVRLWTHGGRTPSQRLLTGHTAAVVAAGVSADGGLLATADADGRIVVRDLTGDVAEIRRIEAGQAVTGLAFDPAAGRLAVASDGVVRFWDPRTGRAAGPVLRHPDVVAGLAVGADGATAVTTSDDGHVRAWDLRTGTVIGAPLPAGAGPGGGAAFAPAPADAGRAGDRAAGVPAGGLAATSGRDGTVRLWNLDRRLWVATLCARAKRGPTPTEWRAEAGATPWRKVCRPPAAG
jgi:WD40 repeat protein